MCSLLIHDAEGYKISIDFFVSIVSKTKNKLLFNIIKLFINSEVIKE